MTRHHGIEVLSFREVKPVARQDLLNLLVGDSLLLVVVAKHRLKFLRGEGEDSLVGVIVAITGDQDLVVERDLKGASGAKLLQLAILADLPGSSFIEAT